MDASTPGSPIATDKGPPSAPKTDEALWCQSVKSHLRARMDKLRKLVPREAQQTRSRSICERVVGTRYFERAKCVVGYVALGKEVDPAGIVAAAHKAGKTVGLPRVDRERGLLSLHRWAPGDRLERGSLGVDEPCGGAPLLELSEVDLILVPALAIDPRGNRIGRGGGYYDRLLATLDHAVTIGIIYDFQLIVESPVEPGDVPVSAVATDERMIAVKPDR
jgi:5-formyltetrahydrofolate cyclo-ligase